MKNGWQTKTLGEVCDSLDSGVDAAEQSRLVIEGPRVH